MKFFLLSLCGSLIAAVCVAAEPAQDRPLARHGALQVVGRHLCDEKGRPVQLRGMSTHGLQWFGWKTKLTPAALDVLATEWRADLLRVAMYVDEGGYLTDPPRYRAMVDALVDETASRGLYCLIDWHMLTPGDPNAHLAEAKAFFAAMAATHGAKRHVLYEICNEPNGQEVTWEKIRRYAEEIIPVIRRHDPDAIIIVGTPAWSSFGISGGPSGQPILDQPLTGEIAKNVMYTFHFYAGEHVDHHRREFEKFAARLPVFVTEWGCNQASGEGREDWESTAAWLALLDREKISACNWNYSDAASGSAVWKRETMPDGPFTDDRLQPAGLKVKQWLRAPRPE